MRRYDPGTGKLTVSTGKKTVTGVLVEDAVATVRSSDIRLAKKGDRISVRGKAIMPHNVRASSIVVNTFMWPSEEAIPKTGRAEMGDADEATSLLRKADKLAKDLAELQLKNDPEWKRLKETVGQAYQRIVDRYPKSEAAEAAQKRLDAMSP